MKFAISIGKFTVFIKDRSTKGKVYIYICLKEKPRGMEDMYMKKAACFTGCILLMMIVGGCVGQEDKVERLKETNPPIPGSQSVTPAPSTTPNNPSPRPAPSGEPRLIANPMIESMFVDGERNEFFNVYLRNCGDPIPSISANCFDWYLNGKLMGGIMEVYGEDCKTVATDWKNGELLCIVMQNKEAFRSKDMIQLVRLCYGYEVVKITVESNMFINLKIMLC